MDDQHIILIAELTKMIEGGGAHATLTDALKDIPSKFRGVKPDNYPIAFGNWQNISG